MSFIAWILLGLTAGFIGSRIVNQRGVLVDIALGIVGAILGGVLFQLVGATGVTGFNVWSLFVATTGASLLLVLYHSIRGKGHFSR
jgi:uncharacterized membrane protein YeaQ/YmgE (transglycosylase-associated protein family)